MLNQIQCEILLKENIIESINSIFSCYRLTHVKLFSPRFFDQCHKINFLVTENDSANPLAINGALKEVKKLLLYKHINIFSENILDEEMRAIIEREIMDFTRESLINYLSQMPIVDINQLNSQHQSLLMIAAEHGDLAMVRFLLNEAKANPNIEDGTVNHKTAMSFAILKNHSLVVDEIINQPNIGARSLNQGLVYYAENGDTYKVQRCLEKGADVNADRLGHTALMHAIEYNHDELACVLINHPNIDINRFNSMRETALHLSLIERRKQVMEALLKRNDINLYQEGYFSGTCLTYAIFSKQEECADRLIAKEIEQYGKFDGNKHPEILNLAIRNGFINLVQKLLELGCDPNNPAYAAYGTWPDWIWKFSEELEMPIEPEETYALPLIVAVEVNNEALVELLMQYDADPNKPDSNKNTALTIAKLTGDTPILQILENNAMLMQNRLSY